MTIDHKQTNLAVRYQYTVTGECFADLGPLIGAPYPIRATWEEAAGDAVEAGGAEWVNGHELRLLSGKIERVR